jgi:AcrR family transcriptional regulator
MGRRLVPYRLDCVEQRVNTEAVPDVLDAPRLTKAERGAATRTRLLDATIDCLVELGWAGTSTTEVVRRAGVSRGAQVHHYPSKEDLVLASIEHLLARRVEEYRIAFDELPTDRRTPAEAFELLWSQCFGGSFDAWLELAVAARRSPALHQRFVEVERRFASATIDRFQDMFPNEFGEREFAAIAMRLAFSVLDGLAIGRIAGVPEHELEAVRAAFNFLTSSFLSSAQGESR